MSEQKERPILMSGAMVRAILGGRKTMTRRVVKPQPEIIGGAHVYRDARSGALFADAACTIRCPYGAPGSTLWVRETFSASHSTEDHTRKHGSVHYRADCDSLAEEMLSLRWTPSIHMPRWASRLTLEVTGVRVERLQDISEEDAIAEGMPAPRRLSCGAMDRDPRDDFCELWDSINAKRAPWASNPWVWVVEFKRQELGA